MKERHIRHLLAYVSLKSLMEISPPAALGWIGVPFRKDAVKNVDAFATYDVHFVQKQQLCL